MRENDEVNQLREIYQRCRWPVWVFGALVCAALIKCFFTAEVPAGHVALLYNWGKLDTAYTHAPGLMWKAPWPMQSVEYFPVRLAVKCHQGEAADNKQQLVDTTICVQLQVNPDKAPILRKEVGTFNTVLSTVVDNNILQATKAETTRHPVEGLVVDRETLRTDVATHLQQLVDKTLADKGITDAIHIVQVGVTQFDFKDGFVKAIDRKVKAEQDAFTAGIQKQITEIDADADAKVTEIIAEANAYATRAVNEAKAEAIQVLGDAAAANPQLGLYEAIESWNAQAPSVNVGGTNSGVNLMLPAPATK